MQQSAKHIDIEDTDAEKQESGRDRHQICGIRGKYTRAGSLSAEKGR